MTYQLDNIMKKVNISEDKFKKALREIFKEEVLNGEAPDNQHPFGRKGTPYENVEDGHGESTVGHGPDYLDKNQGLNTDIVNV